MMGYARSAADLVGGPGADELRTGDLARRGADGLFEVVGRANRFAKLFGLRIDLQRVEAALRERGIAALCATDDDILVTATTPRRRRRCAPPSPRSPGCPPVRCARSPSTSCRCWPPGKPDYPAVRALRPRTRRRDRAARRVRRCAAPGPGAHRRRRQLRGPGRQLAELRDDVGAYRTGAARASGRLAPDAAARAGAAHHPQAPLDRRRWRPAWRCGPSRSCSSSDPMPSCSRCGRGAHPARGRRLQLRPVLPDVGAAPGADPAPAQHDRVDRAASPWPGWRSP